MTARPVLTECARCEQIIVHCSCEPGECPFHGWLHARTGRHLCTRDRAQLAKALKPLSAVA